MSAKKKTDKKCVEFSVQTKDKQWNKPQVAAKEMCLAIGKLAKEVEADGDKLKAVSVKIAMRLDVAGSDIVGVVTEG